MLKTILTTLSLAFALPSMGQALLTYADVNDFDVGQVTTVKRTFIIQTDTGFESLEIFFKSDSILARVNNTLQQTVTYQMVKRQWRYYHSAGGISPEQNIWTYHPDSVLTKTLPYNSQAVGNPLPIPASNTFYRDTTALQSQVPEILAIKYGGGYFPNGYLDSSCFYVQKFGGPFVGFESGSPSGIYSCTCQFTYRASGQDSVLLVFTPLTSREKPIDPQFRLFPNPAPDFLDLPPAVSGVEYSIINSSGAVCQEGQISDSRLGLAGLPPGLYVLRLLAGKGKPGSFRFVKQ